VNPNLTVADIAYVAGVLDAGALVRTRSLHNGTVLPMIQMHVSDMDLLGWLSDLTGVKAVEVKRSYSRHPCAAHCEQAHQHIVSTSGRWTLTGARATVVLASIKPYCRLQRESVDQTLIEGLKAPYKPAVVNRMIELGWARPEEWQ
jgi:hypothetical protein